MSVLSLSLSTIFQLLIPMFLDCMTPLNLTINIDSWPEIPLQSLDLTAEPPEDNQAPFCIGLIQPADNVLIRPGSNTSDLILGVPFMRNVYNIMAYNVPSTYLDVDIVHGRARVSSQ